MKLSSAIVAVAGLSTLIIIVYVGGPWALLGRGLIALAGAAIYGRAAAGAPAPRRRRRRRRKGPQAASSGTQK